MGDDAQPSSWDSDPAGTTKLMGTGASLRSSSHGNRWVSTSTCSDSHVLSGTSQTYQSTAETTGTGRMAGDAV